MSVKIALFPERMFIPVYAGSMTCPFFKKNIYFFFVIRLIFVFLADII